MNPGSGRSLAQFGLMLAIAALVSVCLFIDPPWLGILIGVLMGAPLALVAVRIAPSGTATGAAEAMKAPERHGLARIALNWSPLLLVGLPAMAVWAGFIPEGDLERIARNLRGPAKGRLLLGGMARMRTWLGDQGVGLVGLGLVGTYIAIVWRRVRRSRGSAC